MYIKISKSIFGNIGMAGKCALKTKKEKQTKWIFDNIPKFVWKSAFKFLRYWYKSWKAAKALWRYD